MIAQTLTDNLIAIATAWAEGHEIGMGEAGRRLYGRSSFFEQFRNGERTISIDRYDEMLHAMAKDWPKGTRWPRTTAATITRSAAKNPG